MPVKTDIGSLNCSLARAFGMLGDAWSFLIVRDVLMGSTRFVELRESLGIARNVLTQRLKMLEENGILAREGSEHRPIYRLTDRGYDLVPPLVALMQWGDRWASADGPPIVFKGPGGMPIDSVQGLRAASETISPRDISAVAGPGADERTRLWIDAMAGRTACG